MEIVLLIIGIIIGTVVGYLAAERKSAALKAEISGTKKEIELLKLQKEEAEAVRIAELKERCTKHGLNFDAENQKVLDKRARKAARKAARKGKK